MYYPTKLKKVELTGYNGTNELPVGAFSGCSTLEDIILPDGLVKIGDCAFRGCSSLTKLKIPDTVTTFTVTGTSKNYCGNYLTGCNSLAELSLPTLKAGTNSTLAFFFGADDLSSVPILQKVTITAATEIGANAFKNGSNLTEIHITSTAVQTIDSTAFVGCANIQKLTLPFLGHSASAGGNEATLATMFTNGVPQGLTEITLSGGKVGTGAFKGLKELTTVTLPAQLTELGASAFEGCSALEGIELPTTLDTIGAGAFKNTSLTTISIPTKIRALPDEIFYGCKQLTEVNFNDSDNLTSIGKGAFYGCVSLGNIEIVNTVREIGESAFENCETLSSIALPGAIQTIGAKTFKGCKALGEIDFKNVNSIGEAAMQDCANLTTVTLSDTLQEIATDTFNGCVRLDTIKVSGAQGSAAGVAQLPAKIKKIGTRAFSGCVALKNITFTYTQSNGNVAESQLTDIGAQAFYNDSGLTIVDIPAGVTQIGANAFNGCTALKFVYLPDSSTYASSSLPTVDGATYIARNKTTYDKIKSQQLPFRNLVTYMVTIYYINGAPKLENGSFKPPANYYETAITEQRLYNKPYNYSRNADGSWSEDTGITAIKANFEGYKNTVWFNYVSVGGTTKRNKVTVADIETMLKADPAPAEIDLYATKYSKPNIEFKSDLQYGDVDVPTQDSTMPYINSYLLTDSSDKLLSSVYKIVEWKYRAIGGGDSSKLDPLPENIRDAGVYTLTINLLDTVGEWLENYSVEFTVSKVEISLTDDDMLWVAQTWKTDDGGVASSEIVYTQLTKYTSEYLSGNNIMIVDPGFDSIVNIMLKADAYETIPKAFGAKAYTVGYGGGASQVKELEAPTQDARKSFTGVFKITATLQISDENIKNFVFIESGFSSGTEDKAFQRTITLTNEGKTVTIVKQFLVIENPNYVGGGGGGGGSEPSYDKNIPLIDQSTGQPWSMPASWIFGGATGVRTPVPGYAEAAGVQFTLDVIAANEAVAPVMQIAELPDENMFPMYFTLAGTSEGLTDGAFASVINNGMPVGNYSLAIHIDVIEAHEEYNETFEFTVKPASLNVEDFASRIKNKSFNYDYNGEVQLPIDEIKQCIQIPDSRQYRVGSIWDNEKYDKFYSTDYSVLFSVDGVYRTLSDIQNLEDGTLKIVNRGGSEDFNKDNLDEGVESYRVYYRISAMNYEQLGNKSDSYFEVKINPAENSFASEWECRDSWVEGDSTVSEHQRPVATYCSDQITEYPVEFYTDAACTQKCTDFASLDKFTPGTYYVRVYIPATSNTREFHNEEAYTFTVLAKSALPTEPNFHRDFGLSSPNGFTETTPAQLNVTILLIVLGSIAFVVILVVIIVVTTRSRLRQKAIYERVMMLTANYPNVPPEGYLPPYFAQLDAPRQPPEVHSLPQKIDDTEYEHHSAFSDVEGFNDIYDASKFEGDDDDED